MPHGFFADVWELGLTATGCESLPVGCEGSPWDLVSQDQ